MMEMEKSWAEERRIIQKGRWEEERGWEEWESSKQYKRKRDWEDDWIVCIAERMKKKRRKRSIPSHWKHLWNQRFRNAKIYGKGERWLQGVRKRGRVRWEERTERYSGDTEDDRRKERRGGEESYFELDDRVKREKSDFRVMRGEMMKRRGDWEERRTPWGLRWI